MYCTCTWSLLSDSCATYAQWPHSYPMISARCVAQKILKRLTTSGTVVYSFQLLISRMGYCGGNHCMLHVTKPFWQLWIWASFWLNASSRRANSRLLQFWESLVRCAFFFLSGFSDFHVCHVRLAVGHGHDGNFYWHFIFEPLRQEMSHIQVWHFTMCIIGIQDVLVRSPVQTNKACATVRNESGTWYFLSRISVVDDDRFWIAER